PPRCSLLPYTTLFRSAVLAIVALLLLVAWTAAGPWLAIDGIRRAVADNNAAALERHVDFPALRANLKARADDALARRAGPGFASDRKSTRLNSSHVKI